jgi:virginiamycin B lyase
MSTLARYLTSMPAATLLAAITGCTAMHGTGGNGFISDAVVSNRMRPANVQIKKYPVPSGYDEFPYQIAVGADGALWFTEFSKNRIGRITTSGAFSQYNVHTANSNPNGIFAGTDHAMWFTERTASKIGRIDINTHDVTEFATPSGLAQPRDIVKGPDGALWFTEYGANRIGRITTTGHFKEYVPDLNGPEGITSGTSDGRLWYTGSISDGHGNYKVANITTSGQTVSFKIPTKNSEPWGITPGPNGTDAWFVELAARRVAWVSPGGHFHEYVIPGMHPLGIPIFIVPGPDGALWFTDQARDSIGRVTTSGQFSEYALDQGAQPQGIVLGPDGALWFTENGAIGRLKP